MLLNGVHRDHKDYQGRGTQDANSKHWFTTSFLGGRCRKAMLGARAQDGHFDFHTPPAVLKSSKLGELPVNSLNLCNICSHTLLIAATGAAVKFCRCNAAMRTLVHVHFAVATLLLQLLYKNRSYTLQTQN